MNNSGKLLVAGLSLVLSSHAFALGKTVDLQFQGLGAGRSGMTQFDGASKGNIAWAQQKFKFSNATADSGIQHLNTTTQRVYCVDLSQWTDTTGKPQYTVVTLDGLNALKSVPTKNAKVEGLNKLLRSSYKSFGSAFTTNDNDYAAAFQLCLWDVVYDFDGTAKSMSLTAGRFQTINAPSIAVQTKYNQLRDGLMAETNGSASKGYIGLVNDCNQDYIAAVPEPGTMAAIAVGISALIRRRRKSN